MQEPLLFSEKQKFRLPVYVIFLGVPLLFLYGIYVQLIEGRPWGNNPVSNGWLIATFTLTLLFTLFFVIAKLETRITKEGVYVRFFPIHRSFKFFPWSKISIAYVCDYKPIGEYGGWGIRKSANATAYTTSGKTGLQLRLIGGRKVLIGTRKPMELKRILKNLDRTKTIT